MTPIYLDYQATTPCDPRVVEAMSPCFTEVYGNAASGHDFGRAAARRVDAARRRTANLLACEPREIVFTSGATESINLALRGATSARPERRHLVTCATEHKAGLDVCRRLESEGFELTYLPVDGDGLVSPDDVLAALRPATAMVSLMYANNEIGAIHPIAEIGAALRGRGVLFHCDAAQALSTLDCRVERLGVDLLSLSAHKIYGPKGVGALYVRRRRPHVRLRPLFEGGGQERGMRSGTLNVPGIVGLGRACELVGELREAESARLGGLRDLLLDLLRREAPDLRVNGGLRRRLPHNLNVSFPGVDAQALLAELRGVAVSSGSACTSASFDGSYVLEALPGAAPHAAGSIRCGLGRFTTEDEIRRAAREIGRARRAASLRLAPLAACETACGVELRGAA